MVKNYRLRPKGYDLFFRAGRDKYDIKASWTPDVLSSLAWQNDKDFDYNFMAITHEEPTQTIHLGLLLDIEFNQEIFIRNISRFPAYTAFGAALLKPPTKNNLLYYAKDSELFMEFLEYTAELGYLPELI